MPARYAVGIDLGTTHTVVAEAPFAQGATATVFAIPQLVAPSEVLRRALFPSVLYAPAESEQLVDPFGDAPWTLGEFARRRGAEVAGRVIVSSKSWLVHAGVDRTAPILPWGASEEVPKLSPVEAATRLLLHVVRTWDAEHEGASLADQDVVLTVPASFDEVARELSLEAARRAGLTPKLLEEPQAAFYDWMARRRAEGAAQGWPDPSRDSLVLVVDVGGGTTDLSLIRLAKNGDVTRLAVGPHLLLGGDNMDLALAHLCEPRLAPPGSKLAPATFVALVVACRAAKETLLRAHAPEDVAVTVQTRGAALVGNALTTRLTLEEAEQTTLEGFLPAVGADARPQRGGGALLAFGLPYQRDVAITKHIAAFVARHLPAGSFPDAVLLNGGVFRAERIAERVLAVLASWRGGDMVRLPDADPDLAVARGAVAYVLARRGLGPRIGGGSARGYFVGIAAHAVPESAPGSREAGAGETARPRAVCVIPRGAEEGTTHVALGRTFALALGRAARFELFASDSVNALLGELVEIEEERFARLPPIATTIDPASGSAPAGARGEQEVRVALEGELTPLGTVDLACVETEVTPARRFRLAFQLRGDASIAPPARVSQSPTRPLNPALDSVERAFGKPRESTSGREAKDLIRELERVLGDRAHWTTEQNRTLFDALMRSARARKRSADHERVFWLLAGWCVRPGFGDPGDGARITSLVPLFDERLAFTGEVRGWQQFFIAWRRAAAGLDLAMQTKIRDFVDPHLAPAGSGKRPKKPALSLDDALDLAASLERVPPERRSRLGGWVLERTWTDRDPRLWTAVGKLGARVPAYASVHHVVAPDVVERWLDHLLREKWDVVPTAAPAAVALARRTGDRARDLGERIRREVIERLGRIGAPEEQLRAVRDIVATTEKERVAFFGDALPLGLRLVM
jgi:molecular chaperone DnaK (HSP70)